MKTPTPELPAEQNFPPKGIWLQWHGSGSEYEEGDVSEEDVTWSREFIFSSDLRYISARWMTEQAAKYREQERCAMGPLKHKFRQMAWAFELVLEFDSTPQA